MSITPVPKGHLIKKDGTSLKNGGKLDVFSKIRKSMTSKKEKSWMEKEKKKLSKIQPLKKKK